MTVSSLVSKITYTADGVLTTWDFSFAGVDTSSILVFVTNDAGTIAQIPAAQYDVILNPTVDPNPTFIGGHVKYPLSGPAVPLGSFVTIVRLLPVVQPNSISNQSIIYPPVIEREFDYLTMVDQQLAEQLNRAVKVAIADTPMAPLPSLAFRINQSAVFDSHGNLTAGSIVGGGVIISPAMIPVVTALTLPLARDAMGVAPIDSPIFTGNPQAPTPPVGDNDSTIATTAFVQAVGATLGVLIPSGTIMLFQQTAAPVGWTKLVTHNDKALRVVNGAVGVGGTTAFSTVFGRTATDGHILSTGEMPNHGHPFTDPTHSHLLPGGDVGPAIMQGVAPSGGEIYIVQSNGAAYSSPTLGVATGITIGNSGGGLTHTHPIDLQVQYVDMILAQKT